MTTFFSVPPPPFLYCQGLLGFTISPQRRRHYTTLCDMERSCWKELEECDTELQHFPVKILFGWMFMNQGLYFSLTPEMKTTFTILIESIHKELNVFKHLPCREVKVIPASQTHSFCHTCKGGAVSLLSQVKLSENKTPRNSKYVVLKEKINFLFLFCSSFTSLSSTDQVNL